MPKTRSAATDSAATAGTATYDPSEAGEYVNGTTGLNQADDETQGEAGDDSPPPAQAEEEPAIDEVDPNRYADVTAGWFEISANVKAVRGKNTSDGTALEIVLDASIDSHVASVMGLIGKSLTRVVFKPFVYQQSLPTPAPVAEVDGAEGESSDGPEPMSEDDPVLKSVLSESDEWDGSVTKTERPA
jgi:hypothetical protein